MSCTKNHVDTQEPFVIVRSSVHVSGEGVGGEGDGGSCVKSKVKRRAAALAAEVSAASPTAARLLPLPVPCDCKLAAAASAAAVYPRWPPPSAAHASDPAVRRTVAVVRIDVAEHMRCEARDGGSST